jgi:hypothetical protein
MSRIFILISLLFLFHCAKAQVPATLVSPDTNTTINNGELFIVIKINDSIDLSKAKTNVFLSQINISSLAHFQGNLLTILMEEEINPGPFDLVIQMFLEDTVLYDRFEFDIVNRKSEEASQFFDRMENNIQPEKKLNFTGQLNLFGRYFQTNDKQSLWTEPREEFVADFNGKVYRNNYKIPIRFRVTNLQRDDLQHRNRFFTGVETKHLKFYLGDVHPVFDRHILPGTRVRGVQLDYKYRSTSFHFVQGTLNRGINGNRIFYDLQRNYPQPFLNPDNSFFENGVFRRNITAFKMVFNSIERSQFIITAAKSSDISNSIDYGNLASENLVFSAESKLFTRNDVFTLLGGISMSLTTLDKEKGNFEKIYLDSFVNGIAIYNPSKWYNLVHINNTTLPLSNSGRQSLSYYVTARLKVLKQDINLDIQRFGSSYYSFGNPFLINDRFRFVASDRFRFLKNKLHGNLEYRLQKNNLSGNLEKSATTTLYGINLFYKPKKELPVFFANYQLHGRLTDFTDTNIASYSNSFNRLNVGLNYFYEGEYLNHYVSFSYSDIQQNHDLENVSDFNSRQFNFNLKETFSNNMGFNLGYNSYIQNPEDTLDMFVYSTFSLGFSFILFKEKLSNNVQVFYFRQDTEQGLLPTDHYRFSYGYQAEYTQSEKLKIRFNLGSSNFYHNTQFNDYSAFWVELGASYVFDY